MKSSQHTDLLFTALAQAQAKFTVLKKKVQGHGYKYADLKEGVEMIRPKLKEHNLFFSQTVRSEGNNVEVSTLIGHSSGQWMQSDYLKIPGIHNKRNNSAQDMGTVITYGKRYCLEATLGLVSEEPDTDGVLPPEKKEAVKDLQDKVNNVSSGLEPPETTEGQEWRY